MNVADDPSGLALAERAHAAGAVEPGDVVSTCAVSLSFRARGSRASVQRFVDELTVVLLEVPGVEMPVSVSVVENG